MPDDAATFYARVITHYPDGRLPLPDQSTWDIFPFEDDDLRSKPLRPAELPEPPRGGEDPSTCSRCKDPMRNVVWSDERWLLVSLGEPIGVPFAAMLFPRAHLDLGDLDEQHAAELGQLTVRIDRAVRALGHIGRVHVNRWGDGSAHLHLFFLARPAGFSQLRGSNLALWEEMLPRIPDDITAADLRAVAQTLARDGGEAL